MGRWRRERGGPSPARRSAVCAVGASRHITAKWSAKNLGGWESVTGGCGVLDRHHPRSEPELGAACGWLDAAIVSSCARREPQDPHPRATGLSRLGPQAFARSRCAIGDHALRMPELLLDRDAELETITSVGRVVAGGHGRALLIEGPAGIGKTALMRVGRHVAEELGLVALTARGVELERAFGFGVVRQ